MYANLIVLIARRLKAPKRDELQHKGPSLCESYSAGYKAVRNKGCTCYSRVYYGMRQIGSSNLVQRDLGIAETATAQK